MNPLTVLANHCHDIAYDYDTRTGRIDVRMHVTLTPESYIYAFQVIDRGVQTIEVLRAGRPLERHVRGGDRRWRQQRPEAKVDTSENLP
jgi:hypothetical protein